MKKELPWYARESGRWHKSIEKALASGDCHQQSLAWCVLATVGGDHSCQTKFADLVGLNQPALSFYLGGRNKLSREIRQQINKAVAKHLGHALIGTDHFFHPFEIGAGTVWAVPGDPRWETWWATFRVVAPENPTSEELKTRYPDLFP